MNTSKTTITMQKYTNWKQIKLIRGRYEEMGFISNFITKVWGRENNKQHVTINEFYYQRDKRNNAVSNQEITNFVNHAECHFFPRAKAFLCLTDPFLGDQETKVHQ